MHNRNGNCLYGRSIHRLQQIFLSSIKLHQARSMFVDSLQSNCSTRPPIGLRPDQSDAFGPSRPNCHEHIVRASGSSKASTRCWFECQAYQGERWCSKMFLHHTDSKPYFRVRHIEANTGNHFCSRTAITHRQRTEPPSVGPDSCVYSRLSNENINIKPVRRSDLEPRFDLLLGRRFRYYIFATKKWLQVHSSSSYLLF